MTPTPGKIRGLTQASNEACVFTIFLEPVWQASIESSVRPRFAELLDIAASRGTDWGTRYDLADREAANHKGSETYGI